MLGDKIHSRKNYRWVNPVHEVLSYSLGDEKILTTDNITLNHYPDFNKSRGSYLPLLELSVKENPLNDRNMHYLGREYMYYSRWDECIKTLMKHLELPNSKWKDERCASMRFIARIYINEIFCYDNTIDDLLSVIYYNLGLYDEALFYIDKALKYDKDNERLIKNREYILEKNNKV